MEYNDSAGTHLLQKFSWQRLNTKNNDITVQGYWITIIPPEHITPQSYMAVLFLWLRYEWGGTKLLCLGSNIVLGTASEPTTEPHCSASNNKCVFLFFQLLIQLTLRCWFVVRVNWGQKSAGECSLTWPRHDINESALGSIMVGWRCKTYYHASCTLINGYFWNTCAKSKI